MTPDNELLRQYADTGSQAAFTELVRRYVSLAYTAALRQVGSETALAEDVAQSVFIDLARKARQLTGHTTLAGWVHTSVRFAALRALRDQRRRQAREQEAQAMHELSATPDIHWEQLQPTLDEAVASLGERDREAVLLRFFQGWSHREVAAVLQLTEDATRMRVDRALDKLRAFFAQRGVKTTATLLAAAMPLSQAQTVPAGLAAKLAGVSLASVAPAGAGLGAILGMKLRTALAVGVVAAIFGILIFPRLKGTSPMAAATMATDTPAAVSESSPAPPSPAANNAATAPASTPAPATESAVSIATMPAPPPVARNVVTPGSTAAGAPTTGAPAETAPSESVNALAAANNRFALDLYRRFNTRAGENAFFSPYSVSTALAMTWFGARGQTAAQMSRVLHFNELPEKDVTIGFGALQQAMAQAQQNTHSQFTVANSLWIEQNAESPLLPQYVSAVQSDFLSAAFAVDFQSNAEAARLQINEWVENQTREKIQDLLHDGDVDASTRLVLVNAIYFRGSWAVPFLESATTVGDFHLAGGGTATALLMHRVFVGSAAVTYADFPDAAVPFQMLSMNYYGDPEAVVPPVVLAGGPPGGPGRINAPGAPGSAPPPGSPQGARSLTGAPGGNAFARRTGGELSFIILLPRANTALPALEKSLTNEQLNAWMARLAAERVDVYLPKFRLEQRYSLAYDLKSLGMIDAFIDPTKPTAGPHSADFTGMTSARTLFISKVIHQSFLDVNEKGTEAAAATAVIMARGNRGPTTPPPVFRADHPFLFFIRENTTGSIVFFGRLANPQPPSASDVAAVNNNAARRRGTRGATGPNPFAPVQRGAPPSYTPGQP